MKSQPVHKTIDEYISGFSGDIRLKLNELRLIIKKAAPLAQEKISYRMPAFFQNGVLVYFAAHTKHIGFYPTSSGIRAFEKELAGYKFSKGAIQFTLDKDLPADLITRIVKFRVKENNQKV